MCESTKIVFTKDVKVFFFNHKLLSCQVKQALCSLIQQNIVTFHQNNSGLIEYSGSADAILCRLRFPHYIHCAKTLFGDAAELLVEELLVQGRSTLGDAVNKTVYKLNESLAASGSCKLRDINI